MTLSEGPASEETGPRFGLRIVDQFERGLVFFVEVRVLVIADELRRVLVHVLAIRIGGAGPIGDLYKLIKNIF